MIDSAEVVKSGIWKYADLIECEIRIVKWDILYGTGDYEDPPELCDDREIDCYYIFYESPAKKGEFVSGSGGFLSLKDAVEYVENTMFQEILWRDM